MFNRNRSAKTPNSDTARIIKAVDSESRPYTDPEAKYPIARSAQAAQGQGAQRQR